MKFYNQPDPYTHALDVLNMIFTAVFALEFVFKLAAFRFKVSFFVFFFFESFIYENKYVIIIKEFHTNFFHVF